MIYIAIRVIVVGASGRMGKEVVSLIHQDPNFELVAAVSPSRAGKKLQSLFDFPSELCFSGSVEQVLSETKSDVLVDFTKGSVVDKHVNLAIDAGVRPVVGTSGISHDSVEYFQRVSKQKKLGGIIAPNFAIGAVLMMVFAARASKYLPHVEIIESHGDHKEDAPSGTASKMAALIAEQRKIFKQGHPHEEEIIPHVRGAEYAGFRIHSMRLPGLSSHHEVFLGDQGQLLTIRHDALNWKAAFMPGVKMSIEKVMDLQELVYGLEHLLDLNFNK